MNADKINMVAGSIIAALLVLLLLNFFGKQIFHSDGHDGHGEDAALAFAVETGDESTAAGQGAGEEEVAGIDYASLVAAADLAAGEKQFRKCRACHKIDDGENGVGPHLWRVLGRPVASVEGFGYSEALAGMGGAWGLENLSAFIENPKGMVRGTKMSYAGMKKPADRVNLIAWLNEAGGAPIELAPASDASAATQAADAQTGETQTGDAQTTDAQTTDGQTTGGATDGATAEPAPSADAGSADASDTPAPGGAYAELLANADTRKGRRTFRKCRACHKLEEGENSIGPSLYGVIGRDVASVEGFDYSTAMTAKGGAWTLDELMNFTQAPQSWVPGTKMTFAGLKDEQERINVIVYLNEADGSPEVLE